MMTENQVSTNTEEIAEALIVHESSNALLEADKTNEESSSIDKFKQRLDRFGTIAPEAKKVSRALRFGTSNEAVDNTAKKRRLERFGVIPHSPEDNERKKRQRIDRFHVVNSITSINDDDAKKKRLGRFGGVNSATTTNDGLNENSSTTNSTVPDAIKKRTERFGDISQIAKANRLNEQKVKRAERFKLINTP